MKRNKFSLTHYKLATFSQGELIPVSCMEVLPGDSFQQKTSALIRVSPLVAPMMHPVNVRIHHWYVPLRLIWDDFEDFITGGPDGDDATVAPYLLLGGSHPVEGSTFDYLGCPLNTPALPISALPIRAYQLIWNEWYRDQDLQTAATVQKVSGQDTLTTWALQNAGWEKDYFTTARPWPQKGPEVTIPLGNEAAVVFEEGANVRTIQRSSGAAASAIEVVEAGGAAGTALTAYADLTTATSVSINDLREAMALQRFAEARARYGSRYVEYLRYLGVRSSDARLQRPEYLGGGRETLQISEVLQTGVTTSGSTAGVGNLKGHGIGVAKSNRYRRFFEEHGLVLTLMSVLPKTMYFKGSSRMWNRTTKEDYFQRELQHIGQQEVLNREVYGASLAPNDVWGYQDRYDEYRRQESSIAGEFRSTLNYWHMARDFTSQPTLNGDFVKSNPTNRVYQSTTTDQLLAMVHHSVQARRMLSKRGSSFIK